MFQQPAKPLSLYTPCMEIFFCKRVTLNGVLDTTGKPSDIGRIAAPAQLKAKGGGLVHRALHICGRLVDTTVGRLVVSHL
jgi:hypothetical protein